MESWPCAGAAQDSPGCEYNDNIAKWGNQVDLKKTEDFIQGNVWDNSGANDA